MRKKEQNVKVSVNETKIGDKAGYEVVIGTQTIGTITEESAQRFITQFQDLPEKHFKTLDDAINELLMTYNLYHR
ncbi:MAG: DUF2969 domain-containing protein [Lactobacillus sp.]|jgi:hypothetical protein|nr:DUF2969 domain-containing protein [Lactobacillus sp.]